MKTKYVFTKKTFNKILKSQFENRCYVPYNKVIYKKSFSETVTLLTNFGIITTIIYEKNGKLNREDGPAIQYFNKYGIKYNEKYYLNGEELNELQIMVLSAKNKC